MDRERVGRRIKGFRKLKGYTQMELAKEIGVSLSLLGAVERGTKDFPEGLLDRIAEKLSIDKSELY